MKQIFFKMKQLSKMVIQHMILPVVYAFWRLVYFRKEPELILFADAHHDTMPYSMERIYKELVSRGYSVTEVIRDYGKVSQLQSLFLAIQFMRLYARAKYVFICDNFLPVASCKKSKKTKVIQLWHSCGLLKKMGYHTTEDVPLHYKGNVYKNYDLVTVSAPCCVEPLTGGMRQKPGVVQPLGVSRTDLYFDENWIKACKEHFYAVYPEAKGKKVILWAPTFRGNAADPKQVGTEAIRRLTKELGEGYFIIYKVHPYVDRKYQLSNCPIPTEELLPVADLMITDYSSVLFDFLFFKKPYVLFAPDLAEYEEKRGFYVEYDSLTPYVAVTEGELKESLMLALNDLGAAWIEACYDYHLASCDGQATARILSHLGL